MGKEELQITPEDIEEAPKAESIPGLEIPRAGYTNEDVDLAYTLLRSRKISQGKLETLLDGSDAKETEKAEIEEIDTLLRKIHPKAQEKAQAQLDENLKKAA